MTHGVSNCFRSIDYHIRAITTIFGEKCKLMVDHKKGFIQCLRLSDQVNKPWNAGKLHFTGRISYSSEFTIDGLFMNCHQLEKGTYD